MYFPFNIEIKLNNKQKESNTGHTTQSPHKQQKKPLFSKYQNPLPNIKRQGGSWIETESTPTLVQLPPHLLFKLKILKN